MRPAILQIGLMGIPERPSLVPIGSAFLVDDDARALTSSHVVEGGLRAVESGQAERMVIGLAHPNSRNTRGDFTVCGFEVASQDIVNDIALVKLDQNPFRGEISSGIVIKDEPLPLPHGAVEVDVIRPDEGADVAVSGYPFSEPALVTNSGILAAAWARSSVLEDIYLVDVETNPLNSGGPVYRIDDARVVGICQGSQAAPVRDPEDEHVVLDGQPLLYSSGLTIAVPIRFGMDLIEAERGEAERGLA